MADLLLWLLEPVQDVRDDNTTTASFSDHSTGVYYELLNVYLRLM